MERKKLSQRKRLTTALVYLYYLMNCLYAFFRQSLRRGLISISDKNYIIFFTFDKNNLPRHFKYINLFCRRITKVYRLLIIGCVKGNGGCMCYFGSWMANCWMHVLFWRLDGELLMGLWVQSWGILRFIRWRDFRVGWRRARCVAGVDSRLVFGLVRSGSVHFGCRRCRGVSWFWWGGLGNAFVDHLWINCGFTDFSFPIYAPLNLLFGGGVWKYYILIYCSLIVAY